MNFNLLLPGNVVFGWGRRCEAGTLASRLGRRAFLVDGSRTLRASSLWSDILDSLSRQKIDFVELATAYREPTIQDVDKAAAHLRDFEPRDGDLIIGIGGGSALDLAKALSAMATNRQGGSIRDYLEGIGSGLTIDIRPLPMLAIPTTAGTGTEATRNAVISVDDPPCKKSLRSEFLVPDAVLIDPELTVAVPPAQTAASGMDAITQLIESYISRRAQPVPKALAVEGLQVAVPALRAAYEDPHNQEAREAMSYAAFLSGIALANSGLGMAHGVAASLGALCGVPHGLACAVMLPVVMMANRSVSASQLATLGKMFAADSHLSGEAAVERAISTVTDLCDGLSIPRRLRDLGVQQNQISAIVAGSRGNSMNGNPRELTDAELTEILEENW